MWCQEDQDSSQDIMYCERVAVAVKNMILDCQSDFPSTSDWSSSLEMSSSIYSPVVPSHIARERCRRRMSDNFTHSRRAIKDWELSTITMTTHHIHDREQRGPLSSTFISPKQKARATPWRHKRELNDSMETCCGGDNHSEPRTDPSGVESDLDPNAYQFSSGYSSCGSSTSSGSRLPPAPPTSFASPLSSPSFIEQNAPSNTPAESEDSAIDEEAEDRPPLGRRLPCDGQESCSQPSTPVQYQTYPKQQQCPHQFKVPDCYPDYPLYGSPRAQRFVPAVTPCCPHEAKVTDASMDSDATLFIEGPICRAGVVSPSTSKVKSSSLHTFGRKLKKFRKHFHQFGKAVSEQDPNKLKTLAIL